MKFMLVILITMGAPGEEPKTIEMRIPQENQQECEKAAKKIYFYPTCPFTKNALRTAEG